MVIETGYKEAYDPIRFAIATGRLLYTIEHRASSRCLSTKGRDRGNARRKGNLVVLLNVPGREDRSITSGFSRLIRSSSWRYGAKVN